MHIGTSSPEVPPVVECTAVNVLGHQCGEERGHEDEQHPAFDRFWIINGVPVHGYFRGRALGGYEVWPDRFSEEAFRQLDSAQVWNTKAIRMERMERGLQSVWIALEPETQLENMQHAWSRAAREDRNRNDDAGGE